MEQLNPNRPKLGCLARSLIFFNIGCGLLMTLAIAWYWTAFCPVPEPGNPLFEPNEAANYVTSPLDENGDVDYFEAWHQRASDGVTPENNVMAKLIEVLGPTDDGELVLTEYFDRLGIAPPDSDNGLISFYEWYNQQPNRIQELDEMEDGWQAADEIRAFVLNHPWTANELPIVKQYIDENETSFQLVEEALKRTEYYCPLVCEYLNNDLFLAHAPYEDGPRTIAILNAMRSNLSLGQGDILGSSKFAVQTLELSQKISEGTLHPEWVSAAINNIGAGQLAKLIQHPKTKLKHLKSFRQQVASLKPKKLNIEMIYFRQRLETLNFGQLVLRQESNISQDYLDTPHVLIQMADPETAMQHINRLYNVAEKSIDEDLLQVSYKRCSSEEQRLLEIALDSDYHPINLRAILTGKKARGKQLGSLLTSQMLNSPDTLLDLAKRSHTNLVILKLMIEVEIYQRLNGAYPKGLQALVPKQLTTIPNDPLSNTAMHYVRTDQRYQLYSLGPNGIDEGGNNPEKNSDDRDLMKREPDLSWAQHLKDLAEEEAARIAEEALEYGTEEIESPLDLDVEDIEPEFNKPEEEEEEEEEEALETLDE